MEPIDLDSGTLFSFTFAELCGDGTSRHDATYKRRTFNDYLCWLNDIIELVLQKLASDNSLGDTDFGQRRIVFVGFVSSDNPLWA